MFDKEAIKALQEGESICAASVALNVAETVAALPNDFNLHDLENFQPFRRRARGAMTTRFIAPVAAYVAGHAEDGAYIFIDAKDLTATAILNLGGPSAPGHADNLTVMALQRTAAYAALVNIAG